MQNKSHIETERTLNLGPDRCGHYGSTGQDSRGHDGAVKRTCLVSSVWEKKIIYLLLNITRIFSSFYNNILLACTNDIDWHILNTNKMLNVRHILWLHCRSWCTVATMAASILCLVGLQHYSISRWRDGRIVPRRASVPAHHPSTCIRCTGCPKKDEKSSNSRKAAI